ncbi:MAG: Na+/H+ antiporter subunit C [Burkholderiales bacterium]
MEFLVASALGLITASGVYLLLRPRTFSVVLGLSLLGYAVNGFIFVMGRLASGAPPLVSADAAGYADPLPQALVLTAIVIGFGMTGFIIELALRARQDAGSDHVDGREPGERR